MAANKTKETTASVKDFIDTIKDENQRADAKALLKMMESVTGEKAKMWGSAIVGCGSHHYVYESGREGDMPLAGFSPRKAATVIYGMGFEGSEAMLAKLGKHKAGGGCLYIKRLADVDAKVLQTMLKKSVAAKKKRAK
jgi:hypothetical protein